MGDYSAMAKLTPQSTKEWKRLARDMGNSVKGLKAGCRTSLEGLQNNFWKRGMDMEIGILIEGKKQCIEGGNQEVDKNSKVIAGS